MKGKKMHQWKMNSSIGPIYLIATEKGLSGVHFKKQNVPMLKDINSSKILKNATKELDEYFSGKRTKFTISLDFTGTDFQMKVWSALKQIPYGKTISYKELAKSIKKEKAVRAAGSANGKNPLSIIIPCHRVIASDGTLGGYSGGLENKIKLLKLEERF